VKNPRLIKWRFSRPIAYAVFGILIYLLFGSRVFSDLNNGFDLTDAAVPADEIHQGGPPRDGIPAIDSPVFVSAAEAGFLADEDRVLGLVRDGAARAYPIRILDWHEIVNDSFGNEDVVVSYCPLCGTGMAFDANVAGKSRKFGVSGLLYNSDVLLYDRESESLWSQVMRQAVSGPMKGRGLEQLPMAHTTWQDWRTRHPDTLVLSTQTGHSRDYSRSPYGGYGTSASIFFPVKNKNAKYHPKELVIGINIDGSMKAYPFAELSKGENLTSDSVNGSELQIEFDAANRTGRVLDDKGLEIPSTIAFWFAWYAFYPETDVYTLN
jgi:hypothetical protein